MKHSRGYPLNCSIELPKTNQLVTTDCNGGCLECCLHRAKRTVVVNTERNTLAVSGAVRVTTRAHVVKKEQSDHKPPYKFQRSICLPGQSDTKGACSTASYDTASLTNVGVIPHE